MSKAAHRNRPVIKHTRHHIPAESKSKAVKTVLIFTTIAVLAAIPFCMGKYIELCSPDPYDSGSNVYSAEHILQGAKIGVDERPSAALGTLLVNILGVWIFGFNQTGPKIIQAIFQAAALIVMFYTMRKLFGTLAAAVGTIVSSIYLSAPLIAKLGNVKDQYMIALMVLGISCFVLYRLGSKWWLAALAGAFLAWAPLFKETGYSAATALGLFIIAQPFLKHRTWKKTGIDIGLLFTGAILSLAPLFIWILTCQPNAKLPHSLAFKTLTSAFSSNENADKPSEGAQATQTTEQEKPKKESLWLRLLPKGYVRGSWMALSPEDKKVVAVRVLRYYWLLILPISLAIGSIVLRLIKLVLVRTAKTKSTDYNDRDRFVLLFALWWLIDMIFVWGSPRSYEQYYLPLNASGAMLGGYMIAAYSEKTKNAVSKPKWIAIGILGLLVMIIMSWQIFFGISKSPHSGTIYRNAATGLPERQRGYLQRLSEVHQSRIHGYKGSWEYLGEYIRNHSTPSDKIYVWGWFPGIYVTAQRLSPAPKAFEGTMHTLSPKELSERIDEILNAFKKEPPKFIVDSRKSHFPWDRPPLELWPQTSNGFLPANEQIVKQYDEAYSKLLREKIEPDEALRYEAMKPFREYVMKNYKIVQKFGELVLFERKINPENQPVN